MRSLLLLVAVLALAGASGSSEGAPGSPSSGGVAVQSAGTPDAARPTARQWAGRFARGPLPVLTLLLSFSALSALLKARRGIATERQPFVAGALSLAAVAIAGIGLSAAGGGVVLGYVSGAVLLFLAALLLGAARRLVAGPSVRAPGTGPGLIDISPLLSPRTAVWPGDVPFRRDVGASYGAGGNLELSSITTTVHAGAHADAPRHTAPDGEPIDRRPLGLYYGPCEVVDVPGAVGRIRPADLPGPVRAPRVLLRTGSFPDPERFDRGFASLSPALVDDLAAQGVVLVGIDTPSVDPFDDALLEAHGALLRNGMANLEGLVLGHVVPGLYTLVAFPLRIEGGDGSPVRAVLLP